MKRLYIDLDDTLCKYSEALKRARQTKPINYPQAEARFFENLKPMHEAIRFYLDKLNELYDVWILTAPSIMNPLSYTEKRIWVEENLGMSWCEKLIICPDKSLVKGDYLVDDTGGKGQEEFEGEWIKYGSDEFKYWPIVYNYLMKKVVDERI
jgi:5'-nucleotidase